MGLTSTTTASGIVSGIVLIGGLVCGVSAIVGSCLVPSIGVITGIALTGIATAILLPTLPCLLASCVCIKDQPAIGSVPFTLMFAIFIAAIAASHAICQNISSLPAFSIDEALEFGGYYLGISSGIVVGIACAGISLSIACRSRY